MDTKENREHTLKLLYDAAKTKFGKEDFEKKMHSGLLLSYVNAVYSVLNRGLIQTPLFRVNYAPGNIGLEDLFGDAPVPEKDSIDINAVDLLLACQLRDIPLVLKGDTGIGKTHTTEQFFATILDGKGHYKSMRLSDNSFGNDVLRPFKESYRSPDGMLRQRVAKDSTKKCAGFFCDEINLALNPNAVMALMDGKVNVGDDEDKVGPNVPVLTEKGVEFNGRRKKMQTVFAMNPAEDPKFKTMGKLSAALENRALVYDFPNVVRSAGATLWLPEIKIEAYNMFMDRFSENVSKFIGIDKKYIKGTMNEDWLDVFAYITDSKRSEKDPLNSALEFEDLLGYILSIDQKKVNTITKLHEAETKVVENWNKQLKTKYGVECSGILPVRENSNTKRVSEIVSGLRENLEPRDKAQIKRIADAVRTIRTIKGVFSAESPLEEYLTMQELDGKHSRSNLTLEDFAAAYTFIVRSKRTVQELEVSGLVNECIKTYTELEENFCKNQEVPLNEPFKSTDITRGLKNRALQQAMYSALHLSDSTKAKKDTAQCSFSEYLVKGITDQVRILQRSSAATNPTLGQVMTGRISADLATFAGFVSAYSQKIDLEVKGRGLKADKPLDALDCIFLIYSRELEGAKNAAFPDIYMHRLPRVFGRWD